jgi:hypothetical protein
VEEAPQEVFRMKKIHKKTGEEYLLCPRCKINMKKLVKKDVVIDVCRKCRGMWVDAGELEKLAQIRKEEKK